MPSSYVDSISCIVADVDVDIVLVVVQYLLNKIFASLACSVLLTASCCWSWLVFVDYNLT